MSSEPNTGQIIIGTVTILPDDVRDVQQEVAAWRMEVRLEPGDYPIHLSTDPQYPDTVSYAVSSTIVSARMSSLFAGVPTGSAARNAAYERQRSGTPHQYVCFLRRDSFAHWVLEGRGPGLGICRLTDPSFSCVWDTYDGRPYARLQPA